MRYPIEEIHKRSKYSKDKVKKLIRYSSDLFEEYIRNGPIRLKIINEIWMVSPNTRRSYLKSLKDCNSIKFCRIDNPDYQVSGTSLNQRKQSDAVEFTLEFKEDFEALQANEKKLRLDNACIRKLLALGIYEELKKRGTLHLNGEIRH